MIKRKRLIEFLVAIVFINILLLLSSCQAPALYRVQNPQMMHCGETESNTVTVPKFDSVDDICIAWTDVNRRSHDSLSLFVYRGDNKLIDIIEDKGEGDLNITQESRVIFINNPEEYGYYQTEFVINGRPVAQIGWEIKSQLTPSPTIPAVPPPFRIENPRMVHCTDTPDICLAARASLFDSSDPICVAWTEVNRWAFDSLSLYIFKDDGEFIDIIDDEVDLENSQGCRLISISNPEVPGFYTTGFVASGRPVEQISWSISPTETVTGTLQITLEWTENIDLDLQVIEPNGEFIAYNDPVSSSGGQLDMDVICNAGTETISWPQILEGFHIVRVHYYQDCTGIGEVQWQITGRVNSEIVASISGSINEHQTIEIMILDPETLTVEYLYEETP